MDDTIHLVMTPVREDRAASFERFLTDVVVAAGEAQRPELSDRWQVLRADGVVAGAVAYVFLLHGGSLTEDWELDVLLPAHYGQEETDRLAGEWADTFAQLGPWADATVASGLAAYQLAWTLSPVDLTGGESSPPSARPAG
jgi:hypothetical protein